MGGSNTESVKHSLGLLADAYENNTIVILGKGPSADQVSPALYKDNVVIAINDAEWIADPDVTILHESWVASSIAAHGATSKVYVAPEGIDIAGKTLHMDYNPTENDAIDLMMSRFLDPAHIAIEETMVLTSLEIARVIAVHRGETQRVYMVGFDFDADQGYSRAIPTTFGPTLDGERAANVNNQRHFLKNALYMLESTDLDVWHVGTHEFSEITPAGLNLNLAPAPVHAGAPPQEFTGVEITAEITTNHFGDRTRLEELVRAAATAGADHVKVQKRDVDTFYSAEQLAAPYRSPFGETFGDYRRQLELDEDDFGFLDRLCKELGISWFASVLDQPSFEFMMGVGATLVKLPSTISEHRDFLSYVANNYQGDLVLSTGMTGPDFEQWVLDTFKRQERLYLLHTNSAYPTPDADANVAVVRHYAELALSHPHIIPGYSSHDYGWLGSALAVGAGARMVEKHVKLGNTEWAHFDAVALDLKTEAFRDYVTNVRRAEVLVGTKTKRVTRSEHHKYVPHRTR